MRFTNSIIFIFCTAFLFSCGVGSNKMPVRNSVLSDSLTKQIEKIYNQNEFVGFSVAKVNEHGVLYEKGFGYADKSANKLYTQNTIQNIGSISKMLVGIALQKAQDLGKLNLDDPINKYLPFKVVNPFFPELPITIRQLSNHTSTITDNQFYLQKNYKLKPGQNLKNLKLELDDEQVFIPNDSAVSLKSYLENAVSVNGIWKTNDDFLNQKPGERFEYSNTATALAAYIVELATGEDFSKFTRKYILEPLKMKHSGWKFDEINFSNYSRLYYTKDTLLPYYSLVTYPDGNFISSAHDMSKFLVELIKGYSGDGTLLTKAGYKEYFTPQLSASNFEKRNEKNPYSDEYNVGTFVGLSFTGNVGHTGGDPGVSTMMFFDPKTKIGRLLIVNTNINNKKGNDEFYNIWNKLNETL